MNAKYANLIRAIVGGLLLWAAWPTSPLTFLIFVAWIPLLIISENVKNWKQFFLYTYITMLLWNVLATWWVAMSTVPGGISAFLVNSLVMCVPWILYYITKKYVNRLIAGFSLIAYWISFEYLHFNWDLSWPWLALGNVFATHPHWVQWYEYTGATGGSLWVLLSNVVAFNLYQIHREEGRSVKYLKAVFIWAIILCLPVLISFLQKKDLVVAQNKYNVVVVQPNIDPWDEKFVAGKEEAQLQKLITLSASQIDANTALVVWPETAIPVGLDEDKIKENYFLNPVWSFLRKHPQINLLTGIEGYRRFDTEVSRTAKKIPNGEGYYESYNSAALFDSAGVQIYHKSKLVPGVELLPSFLYFMKPVFEKFGGTTGGYTKDTMARVLNTTNRSFKVAPAICYESVYGDYLASFMQNEANLIAVITNDGWWGNTQGHKQHMNYGRLRAIENRKWVVRSANTGISCFIDPLGNVVQALGWDKEGAMKQDITAFTHKTFFAKNGDLTALAMIVFSVLFILMTIYFFIKSKQ